MDLQKGDKVKFKDFRNGTINVYYTDSHGIPESLIKHGTTLCKTGEGTVYDFYEDFVIVEHKNGNSTMRLGYKQDRLECLTKHEATFTISYVDLNGETKKVNVEATSKEEALSSIKAKSINYVMGG